MKEFALTARETRNVMAGMVDVEKIKAEIARAEKAGFEVDPSIKESCQECEEKLKNIFDTFVKGEVEKMKEKKEKKGKKNDSRLHIS